MKKRFLSIVMMCLMVFLLTACGNKNDDLQSNLKDEDITQEKMSEALENHKLWLAVVTDEVHIAKDDELRAVYTFEDGMLTAYAPDDWMSIGDLKGMSDEEILDMMKKYKVDGTPTKYTLEGETDDTGNYLLTESIEIDSSVSDTYRIINWWLGDNDYSPCYNGYTIYDNIYNGFYYTWNKASGESTFLITRMKGGEPPQAFMLDDTDTKGIEVD